MKKYNALIIGAGSIGALKPDKLDNIKSKNILTIAHAFKKNPQINLIGIIDIDKNKAIEAGKSSSSRRQSAAEE